MASVLSHAVAALSIGTCYYNPRIPKRVWAIGALCSAVPDLDVIGFRFGIKYGDFWGHRGFTHSLTFAALLALVVTAIAFRRGPPGLPAFNRFSICSYLFLATASHGLLDAMTDGGLGVAFFAPFDNRRYFLPWTPIRVSPIGVGRFFTARGLAILESEILLDLAACGVIRGFGVDVAPRSCTRTALARISHHILRLRKKHVQTGRDPSLRSG